MATRVRDLSYYDTQYITVCYTDHVLAGSGENKYLRPVERTKEVEIRIHVNTSPVERSVEFCCDALEDKMRISKPNGLQPEWLLMLPPMALQR